MNWLKRWLRAWLAVPEAPTKPPEPSPSDFFSTHTVRDRGDMDRGEWDLGLSARAFPRRPGPPVKETYPEDGGGVIVAAMDSAGWDGGGSDLKSAFAVQGDTVPAALAYWYVSQTFIGYQMCAVLAQHWFINKACTMPARDAIRNGYEITLPEGIEAGQAKAIKDELEKLDKRFGVKANAREFVRHCRIYGVRIALFVVESADADYYTKPFNPDGVGAGTYKGISQVDPYWITPELNFGASADPANIHFYEPTYWRINGKRYHRSHLIIIRTCDLPDVLKPTYFYGGIPLPQQIYERCYAAERTANEAPQLAMTKRLTTLKVDTNAATANESDFRKRLYEWTLLRDNYGVKVHGQNEEVGQHDTSLTDFEDLIMTQYVLACAIAAVPVTKMLGVPPKGLNATGESDEANYHEELESIQENDMAPLIERHHLLSMLSYVAPKLKLETIPTVSIVFEDTDAETAKEKSEREKTDADRDFFLARSGAIDGIDIRGRLIQDKGGSYAGIEEVEPEGPRPIQVIDPGAEKTAPNDPTTAQQAPPAAPPKPGSAAA